MDELLDLFLSSKTKGAVHLCSLINNRGGGPRSCTTRDRDKLKRFAAQWDVAGRGMFFCVSLVKPPRDKSNFVQAVLLHADADFKDQSEEVTREKLAKFPFHPSMVVRSGNGLHLYWFLDEPAKDKARVERVLKLIAGELGTDAKVAQCVSLMRLPGSHNTKDGTWKDVTVEEHGGNLYDFDDFERTLETEVSNPFLTIYRPPLDPEELLAEMDHGNVHDTQLTVTASLLSRGMAEEEVVGKVLEATRSVDGADKWDWHKEEQQVRNMCSDWLRKHPQEESNVVSLAAAQAERADAKVPKGKIHAALGLAVLDDLRRSGQDLLLTSEQFWWYRDGLWQVVSTGEAKNRLDGLIEVRCRSLKITSTQRVVNETKAWMLRDPGIVLPQVEWDRHRKIPTRSGLLDPRTLELKPLAKHDFATYRIESEYDPGAQCPWWSKMLADCFSDKPRDVALGYVKILQEVFGAALLEDKPRELMKALVLVGPSNSGKSSILNVMSGLLCDSVNSTPFDLLENTHGLIGFLRRAPWVLHEAFDQSKWHFSATVKALLSGDHVSVNVKNGPVLTMQYKNPVLWGTNSLPQFREATRAIVNRLIVVPCTRVFSGVTGASEEAARRGYASGAQMVLALERPGVLNWALQGMARILEQGRFSMTTEADAMLDEVSRDSNMVAGFIEECVEFDGDYAVAMPDFCASFAMWWSGERGEDRRTPSNESIGRAVRALADPRVTHVPRNSKRWLVGVKLSEVGLDYWDSISMARGAEGRTTRISSRRGDVNTPWWS